MFDLLENLETNIKFICQTDNVPSDIFRIVKIIVFDY